MPRGRPAENSAIPPEAVAGPAGRPRDLRLDRAILEATRALVVEQGYIGLSLAAVAERANTTTAAIYRRWSGKPELVHEAVFPTEASEPPPRTGDPARDIRAMVDHACAILSRTEVRAALPGLTADMVGNPELHARMFDRLTHRFTAQNLDVDAAGRRDLPYLIEAIVGAAMFHVIVRPGAELDDSWAAALTDMLVHGWRPKDGIPAGRR